MTKNEERLAPLRAMVETLSQKDQAFAKSLISGHDKRGLSDKQWYWVNKLTQPQAPKPPTTAQVDLGDFYEVASLFQTARKHMKFPRIQVVVDTTEISLWMSGAQSSHPGYINVSDGRPYGQSVWYGRISPKGEWTANLRAGSLALQTVEQFLLKFSAAPAKTAAEYGRLTGHCCFCSKPLTDPQSTAAGFGPTCAKNYGLEAEWNAAQPLLSTAK